MNKSRRFIGTYGFLKGNVGVLIFARIIWSLSSLGTRSFLSLYILALGGSAASIGLFNTLASIAQFITNPVGGYLSDFADRRKVLGIFTVSLALAHLSYVFAPNVATLLIGTFIINSCYIQNPALHSLVADSLSDEQLAVGYSTRTAIERITPFILALFGGILVEKAGLNLGVRLGYASYMVGGLLAAYIRYRFLRETRDPPMKAFSFRGIPVIFVKSYREIFSFLRETPKEVKVLTLIAVLGSVVGLFTGPFWLVYATELIGVTPSQWGFMIMFSGVLAMITSFFAGHLVNKFGRKRTMVVSLFLGSLLVLSFIYCQTFLHVLIFWSLLSVLVALLTPAFQALFMGMVPSNERGRAIAALGIHVFNIRRTNVGLMVGLGFFAYIPAIAVTLISGYIYSFNPAYPWFLLSVFLFMLALLTLIFINEKAYSKSDA